MAVKYCFGDEDALFIVIKSQPPYILCGSSKQPPVWIEYASAAPLLSSISHGFFLVHTKFRGEWVKII
jgi:hypothetical protein